MRSSFLLLSVSTSLLAVTACASDSNVDNTEEPAFSVVSADVTIAAGEEVTKCFYFHTPNEDNLHVHKWVSDMTTGSHHMIYFTSLGGTQPPDGTVDNCEAAGQPLPDRARLEDHIQIHLRKLLGRPAADALQVVPTEGTALTAALVAALLSSQHGHPARVEDDLVLPERGTFVTVGRSAPDATSVRGDRYEGHLAISDDPRHRQLTALVNEGAYGQAV